MTALDDLLAQLASDKIAVRIEAVRALAAQPDAARPRLAGFVSNLNEPLVAKLWAIIALLHVRDDSEGTTTSALFMALSAPEAVIRRSAIDALGALGSDASVHEIAKHLHDHQEIADAWFDDSSTPSHAHRIRHLSLNRTGLAMSRP